MFNPRLFYTLGLWLLLPYAFFHLYWRGRRQPEYRQHIAERFGRYTQQATKPVIWLHAVSVGETRATATLVARLLAKYPEHQILITHTTPTGRATSEQLFGDAVIRAYLPYDYPYAIERFLAHFKPRIGILLETEVWFNLIHACHKEGIPLQLLNARLSEKSAARYARFPKLMRQGLKQLEMIAAQSEDDGLRLAAFSGHAIPVMGNLKYDIEPPESLLELGIQLRDRFGKDRPVFLAASTREGEEELLLTALQHADIEDMLTIIVPRHPQRFDEVEALIRAHGFNSQRRSAQTPITADTQIVLGDSMGEMFAYYAASDVAFIGGSLLPYGGQNLIEACAVGKPVLIGPHTYNFSLAAEQAIACGAAACVPHADDLVHQLHILLHDPELLRSMGEKGQEFVSQNQGATLRAVSFIDYALKHAQYRTIIAPPA